MGIYINKWGLHPIFIILVGIQGGYCVSLRLLSPRFLTISRANDISWIYMAFEIVHRAQHPWSVGIPEVEGILGASFRDRGLFEITISEISYRILQARVSILGHTSILTRPFIANSAFEVIYTMARNLGITSCPLKSICSNPKRRKLLNYFLWEPYRHTLLEVVTCQLGIAQFRHSSALETSPRSFLTPFRRRSIINPHPFDFVGNSINAPD